MKTSKLIKILLLSGLLALTACGGGGDGAGENTQGEDENIGNETGNIVFTIGGTVSGLTVSRSRNRLILQNDGGDDKTITTNGAFIFDTAVDDGKSYTVTVATQPDGQSCTVNDAASGTVNAANVTTISVVCIDSVADTIAPRVISSPGILPFGNNQKIIIVFDESMNTLSEALGGTLATGIIGIEWSDTNITGDTLTLSSGWPQGEEQTLSVNATDLAGNPLATLNLTLNIHTGTLYFVSSTATDDSGDGLSPTTAMQTIQTAIDVATPPASVIVNAGTYNVDSAAGTHVIMKEGVSLIGGYNDGYTGYDRVTNVTTITDISNTFTGDAAFPHRTVEAGAEITGVTEIDGFTINGGGGDYSVAVRANGSLTVQNNVIDGGNVTLQSYGIYTNANTSVTIQDNTISGGSGAAASATGIYNTGPSNTADIQQNVIDGGSGTSSYGIYNDAAIVSIAQNTIDGGAGSTTATGIHNRNASFGEISRNTISGGSGGDSSYGMNNDASSLLLIHNNLVDGGSGDYSYGIYEENNATSTIRNNTISGGSGATGAFGIGIFDTSNTTIENNIIFTESNPAFNWCIVEWNTNSDPVVVDNNDFFGCNGLYRDENATTLSIININAITGTGNVALDPDFCTGFFCFGKWRLTGTTPSSIITGGKNGTVLGWGFTDDKEGKTRPATSGWSMGAYRCPEPNVCSPTGGL